MSDYLKPALAVALPNLGGLAGVPINRRNRAQWFNLLKKPAWKPPDRVFAPMWTFLYSSMGYASYLVWRDGGGFSGAAMKPLTVYGAQLVLNWAWTPIFFGLRSLKWGLVEMGENRTKTKQTSNSNKKKEKTNNNNNNNSNNNSRKQKKTKQTLNITIVINNNNNNNNNNYYYYCYYYYYYYYYYYAPN
nr:hypothetical protein BaRGS_013557 [Batillaria attramentaria]